MRTPYFLLLSSIVLSSPAAVADSKPGAEATPKAAAGKRAASVDEAVPPRPTRKNRVRYTFPPPAKRM